MIGYVLATATSLGFLASLFLRPRVASRKVYVSDQYGELGRKR